MVPERAMSRIASRSMSAASLGSKRMEGRVKGRFCGSESAFIRDLMVCNWEAMEAAIAGGRDDLRIRALGRGLRDRERPLFVFRVTNSRWDWSKEKGVGV